MPLVAPRSSNKTNVADYSRPIDSQGVVKDVNVRPEEVKVIHNKGQPRDGQPRL